MRSAESLNDPSVPPSRCQPTQSSMHPETGTVAEAWLSSWFSPIVLCLFAPFDLCARDVLGFVISVYGNILMFMNKGLLRIVSQR